MKTAHTARRTTLAALAAFLALGTALPAFSADTLTVFDWSGYEDPAFHPAYTEKHGGSPDFSFFGDEEEAFQKLRSGFKADVAHPCAQSIVKWREAGLLEPLDTARLAAWNDILPAFKDMKNLMTSEDGTAWFLPFEWGNTVLTYRTDTVTPEEIASLRAFADPKFKDRVSIGDNVDDAYALASLAIGVRRLPPSCARCTRTCGSTGRTIPTSARRWRAARSISPGPGTRRRRRCRPKASRSPSRRTPRRGCPPGSAAIRG
jgi:spermidine/putrescine transport system substrate-binding protein